MNELQLIDYEVGYRFRVTCKSCKYGWYEVLKELIALPATHDHMYLDEVSALLVCRECKTRNSVISPLLNTKKSYFIGDLA